MRAVAERIFADTNIRSITADPQFNNVRSIRCIEKAMFASKREMETPEGQAWLMRLHRSRHKL